MPLRASLFISGLFILSLGSMLVSLGQGSLALSPTEIFKTFTGEGFVLHEQIVMQLRIPRILNAFICGGLLALSGALLQVLVRNPLADPYILGLSGGAAVGALLSLLMGVSGYLLSVGALSGALVAMLLVYMLARSQGPWSSTRLLLTGVILAAGWGAVISFILTMSPSQQLHSMLFWLMGDLSFAHWQAYPALVLVSGLLLSLSFASSLNLLQRGEQFARSLGVNDLALQRVLFVLTSLLTATAVMQVGSVGFVGLVVPHLVRLLGFSDHRVLLPACVLLGGSLLVIADTIARTLLAPQQLPVGIITAFIGVPLFLLLIRKGKGVT